MKPRHVPAPAVLTTLFDSHGELVDPSDAGPGRTGGGKTDVPGRFWREPRVQDMVSRVLAGEVVRTEIHEADRTFGLIWEPLRNAAGEVTGGRCTSFDVTDKIAAVRDAVLARHRAEQLNELGERAAGEADPSVLRALVARYALELGAAAVVVVTEHDGAHVGAVELVDANVRGTLARQLEEQLRQAPTRLARLFDRPARPLRGAELRSFCAASTWQPLVRTVGTGPVAAAPLTVASRRYGGIVVIRAPGAEEFSGSDIAFLSELATRAGLHLGNALAMDELARAERIASLRARQQAMVADLGAFAMRATSLQEVLDRAVTVVAEGLQVPLAKIMEYDGEGGRLTLRAAFGWPADLVGVATVGTHRESQAGYTLEASEPVLVADLALETRFHAPSLLTDQGVVSGIGVRIDGRGVPFGIVSAHDRVAHRFTPGDVEFLRGVGHLVAGAVERAMNEHELHRRSMTDPVTGLASRTGFAVQAAAATRSCAHGECAVTLVLVDLDRFQAVNDVHGHDVGDEVLRRVADRLRACAAPTSIVARLGADEFAVLHQHAATDDVGARVVDLSGCLTGPTTVEGEELFISAALGVVTALPGSRMSAGDLLRDAEIAMYRAKAHGTSYELFDPRLRELTRERLATQNALHTALARKEFRLVYQPIVRADNGHPVAVEALLRWERSGVTVSPDRFIPLAEETGVIVDIGRWVLRQVCQDLVEWDGESPHSPRRATVNVSGRQLADPALTSHVVEALRHSGLDPHRLVLEITETGLVQDPDQAVETLGALRSMGVRVSIDDFGSGYSSLSQLRALPVTGLKIDQSFIARVTEGEEHVAFIRAVVAMGHALRLIVVAEGVETEGQAAVLRSLGCDLLQGYLFGEPVSRSEMQTRFTGAVPSPAMVPDEDLPVATPTGLGESVGRSLAEEAAEYHAFFENSVDGLMVTSPDGRVLDANPAACTMLGYSVEEIRALGRAGLVAPDDERWTSALRERHEHGSVRAELSFRRVDGSVLEAEISSVLFSVHGEERSAMVIRDIAERRRLENRLRETLAQHARMALVDDLTGLANRRCFFTVASRAVAEATAAGRPVHVLAADVDNLKARNDEFGHQEGDRLLVDVATVLSTHFAEATIIARLSGDEFALLLEDVDLSDVTALTKAFPAALERRRVSRNRPGPILVSLGRATQDPQAPMDLDTLIRQADQRMYRAKRRRSRARS